VSHLTTMLHRPLVHLVLWQFGLAKSETQTTEAERNCLARHAAGKKKLAEIGVYHGVTTRRLRDAMDPQGILLAIDPFPRQMLGFSAHRIIARHEVSAAKSGNINWMRTTGARAADELKRDHLGSFDFLFIDGDHSWDGIQGDWEGWRNLIAPCGIVALHDSRLTPLRSLEGVGTLLFVQQVISPDPDFQEIDGVDSLTVFKRRAELAV
jgi:hypothetical protein